MSLAVMALRLAAVEALAPTAAVAGEAGAGFPTLAAGRVADTEIAPRDAQDPETALPFLAVYSEDGRWKPESASEPTLPMLGETTIVVECEVRALQPLDGGDDGMIDDIAETDAAAEAMIDLLVAQVLHTLEVGGGLGGRLWRRIRREVTGVESLPIRDAMQGTRLTRRTLRISVRHYVDDWTKVDGAGRPWPLSLLAAELPAGGYAAGLVAAVTERLLPAPDAVPGPLTRIDLGLGLGARPATVAGAPIRAAVETGEG